jgi:glycosyltransferase involved in cell wall biosynthesis
MGPTVSLTYIIREFVYSGYDVFVLTPKGEEQEKILIKSGAKIVKYGNRFIKTMMIDWHFSNNIPVYTLAGTIKLAKDFIKFIYGIIVTFKAIKKVKPSIIYVNEYVAFQASIMAYIYNIPSVIHIRSSFLKGSLGIRNYILRKLVLKFNKAIIPITNIEAEQFGNLTYKQNKKIHVIGEFLDENNFMKVDNVKILKNSLGISSDKIVFLMLGGLSPIKGSLDFLKAAYETTISNKNVFFILAGPSSSDKQVEDYLKNCNHFISLLEQNKSILVTNEIDDSLRLIRLSDVVVSPIIKSHFSRPIIEAWACKKAIITTDNTHALNLVSDSLNGIIVKSCDYKELASAMIRLIKDQDLRNKLGNNGYNIAFKKFNARNNSKKIVSLCNSILHL